MRRAVEVIAVVVVSVAASTVALTAPLAASRRSATPWPASLQDRDIQAWIDASIRTDAYSPLGLGEDGYYFVNKRANDYGQFLRTGMVSAVVRVEAVREPGLGPRAALSALRTYAVECAKTRLRPKSVSYYADHNLEGASLGSMGAGGLAKPPEPGSPLVNLMATVCKDAEHKGAASALGSGHH